MGSALERWRRTHSRASAWIFYEIDPEVERIARDARYFTHLAGCGSRCEVVIGDARLSLQQRSDMHDVIVLDAFSSDSIPIHLLTREAVELYLSRLTMDGILAIHISNNHLNLRPVVAGVMRDLGLAGRVRLQNSTQNIDAGRFASHWAVLARSETALGAACHRQAMGSPRAAQGTRVDGRLLQHLERHPLAEVGRCHRRGLHVLYMDGPAARILQPFESVV